MGFTKEDKQFISSEIKNCEANLLQQIGDLRSQVQTLNEENAELRRHLITADRRIDDLEQYGRRQNIRVENLTWIEGESAEQLESSLIEEFEKGGVKISDRDIIRLHRSSKPKEQKDGSFTKQCIIKLSNWKAREAFAGFNRKVKNNKAINIRINNDLTQRRLVLLKDARSRIRSGLLRSFTEDEIKDGLQDNHNIFAYANIQSDLRIRV